MTTSSPAGGHDATVTLTCVVDSRLLLTPFQSRIAPCPRLLNENLVKLKKKILSLRVYLAENGSFVVVYKNSTMTLKRCDDW